MIKDINIGQSYNTATLQDIGNKKENEIEIFGNHFRPGTQAIHIKHKKVFNAWFVFSEYIPTKGSFYKCVYNQ